MATGKVIQILGPVIDVEFPPGDLPGIFNALEIKRPTEGRGSAATDGNGGKAGKAAEALGQHPGRHARARGAAAPGQQLGAHRRHVDNRRPVARPGGQGHRWTDHRAGRPDHPGAPVQRAWPSDRRKGRRQGQEDATPSIASRRPSTRRRPRTRSSRPASRSST